MASSMLPNHADSISTGSQIKVEAMVTVMARDEVLEHTIVTGGVVVVEIA